MKNFFADIQWKNLVLIIAGSVIFSSSYALFLQPNHIAPGGVSGLGMAVNAVTGFPLGITVLVMNIPLLILALHKFGLKLLAATVFTTVISSLLIDVGLYFIPLFTEDLLLASLYGGLLQGVGVGMIFLGGGTTGGTTIIGKLLRLKFPNMRIGRLILLLDTSVILICATVFRDINLALYAAITVYVSAIVIDGMLYGYDSGVLAFIIAEKHEAIAQFIIDDLGRGITFLPGVGGYTNQERRVLMCALRKNEANALHGNVAKIDPSAFVIVTTARDIYGDGFADIKNRSS